MLCAQRNSTSSIPGGEVLKKSELIQFQLFLLFVVLRITYAKQLRPNLRKAPQEGFDGIVDALLNLGLVCNFGVIELKKFQFSVLRCHGAGRADEQNCVQNTLQSFTNLPRGQFQLWKVVLLAIHFLTVKGSRYSASRVLIS